MISFHGNRCKVYSRLFVIIFVCTSSRGVATKRSWCDFLSHVIFLCTNLISFHHGNTFFGIIWIITSFFFMFCDSCWFIVSHIDFHLILTYFYVFISHWTLFRQSCVSAFRFHRLWGHFCWCVCGRLFHHRHRTDNKRFLDVLLYLYIHILTFLCDLSSCFGCNTLTASRLYCLFYFWLTLIHLRKWPCRRKTTLSHQFRHRFTALNFRYRNNYFLAFNNHLLDILP